MDPTTGGAPLRMQPGTLPPLTKQECGETEKKTACSNTDMRSTVTTDKVGLVVKTQLVPNELPPISGNLNLPPMRKPGSSIGLSRVCLSPIAATRSSNPVVNARVAAFREQVEASRSNEPDRGSVRQQRPMTAAVTRSEKAAAWDSVTAGLFPKIEHLSDSNFKMFVEHYRDNRPSVLSEIEEISVFTRNSAPELEYQAGAQDDFDLGQQLELYSALYKKMEGVEKEFTQYLVLRKMIGLGDIQPEKITRDEFSHDQEKILLAKNALSKEGNLGGLETELKHALLTQLNGTDLDIDDKVVLAANDYLEIQVDHSAFAGNQQGLKKGDKKPIIELVLKPVDLDEPKAILKAIRLKTVIETELKKFYKGPGAVSSTKPFNDFLTQLNATLLKKTSLGIEDVNLKIPSESRSLAKRIGLNNVRSLQHKRWTLGSQLTTTIGLNTFAHINSLMKNYTMDGAQKRLLTSSHEKAKSMVNHMLEQTQGQSTVEPQSIYPELIGWLTNVVMLMTLPHEGSDNLKNRLPLLQKSHPMMLFKKSIPKAQQQLVTDFVKQTAQRQHQPLAFDSDGTPKTLRPMMKAFANVCEINLEDRAAERGLFTPNKQGLLNCLLADQDIAGSDWDTLSNFLGFMYLPPNKLFIGDETTYASAYEMRMPYKEDLVAESKSGKFRQP